MLGSPDSERVSGTGLKIEAFSSSDSEVVSGTGIRFDGVVIVRNNEYRIRVGVNDTSRTESFNLSFAPTKGSRAQ